MKALPTALPAASAGAASSTARPPSSQAASGATSATAAAAAAPCSSTVAPRNGTVSMMACSCADKRWSDAASPWPPSRRLAPPAPSRVNAPGDGRRAAQGAGASSVVGRASLLLSEVGAAEDADERPPARRTASACGGVPREAPGSTRHQRSSRRCVLPRTAAAAAAGSARATAAASCAAAASGALSSSMAVRDSTPACSS